MNMLRKKEKTGKTVRKSRIPSRRSINLAEVTDRSINRKIAVPAILAILIAAMFFSKVGVLNRLQSLQSVRTEVNLLQAQADDDREILTKYKNLEEKYARVTTSGMTEDELTLVNRGQVMDLLQRVVLPQAEIVSWSMAYNRIDLPVSGKTLQELNMIIQQLEADPMVNYCTITSAEKNTDAQDTPSDTVTANITIYLNPDGSTMEEEVE